MKVINVIQDVGSLASRKRYRYANRDHLLVVTIPIDCCVVILIDTGNSANILFKDTFKKMGI